VRRKYSGVNTPCWWLQAEMNRLTQLADILGMSQLEVAAVQSDLAEQAYKSQVGG